MSTFEDFKQQSGSTMSDDQITRFSQGIRKEVVDQLIANGLPTDGDDRGMLLELLKDLDRTALVKLRIASAEQNANDDRRLQLAVAALEAKFGRQSPLAAVEGGPVGRLPQLSDEDLPQATLVECETLVGIETTRYDEFIARTSEQ